MNHVGVRITPVRTARSHGGAAWLLPLACWLVTAGCGAMQTRPEDPTGAAGLRPTQEDRDAGLVGMAPGFDLKGYRVIAVDRFPVAGEITDGDDKKLAAKAPVRLQAELVQRLRASGLFAQVIDLSEAPLPPGAERALRLEGTITELTGGSRALRFWISFGAGRSKVQAETRFVDVSSGQVVLVTADRRVGAISDALSLDYGGDSEDLVRDSVKDMARDLARFLARLARGEAPKGRD